MKHNIKNLKSLFAGLSIILGMLMCLNILSAEVVFNTFNPDHSNAGNLSQTINDTLPFATVFVYRPANQLSRKYKVNTNIDGSFDLKKNEVVKMDAGSNTFFIEVDAIAHKKQAFTFNLDQNKTHYFRIQDRNNYVGFLAFLEVIEVMEETFKREKR